MKQELKILGVRTREDILFLLYDAIPRSAYKIAKEINLATATIIEHLNKLEDAGMVSSEDTTKGNLRRRSYQITEKGKTTLIDFLKTYMQRIKENPELARAIG